jgi:hypothetical protein
VVLGILGMHAIGLHGSQHADSRALAAPPAMLVMNGEGPISASHEQGGAAVMDHDRGAAVASPLDLGHGMTGMAMLCIAVLVGAAALMLIRSQRGSRPPLRERLMTSMRVARRTLARQTGPPTAWAFSVIRC